MDSLAPPYGAPEGYACATAMESEDRGVGDQDDNLPDSPVPYFRDGAGLAVAEKLGVIVSEGEYLGSTYYAAVLTVPVADANRRARALGVSVSFVEKTTRSNLRG